jgi:uncharacterized membrane protein YeaQ/YmgE (transglycosylase-associated protein family)
MAEMTVASAEIRTPAVPRMVERRRAISQQNCSKTIRDVCDPRTEINMSIIGWLILGLISGFIASKVVNKQGEGVVLDIVLGIVGALVGGWLFVQFGGQGITGFNLYSMLVSIIGAVVVLVVYHAVRRA